MFWLLASIRLVSAQRSAFSSFCQHKQQQIAQWMKRMNCWMKTHKSLDSNHLFPLRWAIIPPNPTVFLANVQQKTAKNSFETYEISGKKKTKKKVNSNSSHLHLLCCKNELYSMKAHEAFFSIIQRTKKQSEHFFVAFLNQSLVRIRKKKPNHSKKRWKRKFNCKIHLYDIKSGSAIMHDSISPFARCKSFGSCFISLIPFEISRIQRDSKLWNYHNRIAGE